MKPNKKATRQPAVTINADWKKQAKYRKKNQGWLRYSSKIALRILTAIEDNKDLTQVRIAKEIGVTPQQIHKIVKGEQNLTLKTIYSLSEVLGVDLISFPEYKYSKVQLKGQVIPDIETIALQKTNSPRITYQYQENKPRSIHDNFENISA